MRQEALELAIPYSRNLIEFEANRLVGALMAEPLTHDQAAERLRGDTKTSAPFASERSSWCAIIPKMPRHCLRRAV